MDINNLYYTKNAKLFIESTIECDMQEQYNLFLKYLSKKATTLLDLGFGSARDILYFKSLGYEVYGIDPNKIFCEHAKKLGLNNIYEQKVEDMNFINMFDGIWACASLLHIKPNALKLAFNKCYKALKGKGILYASFKYGDFYGERNGRYFTYLNELEMKKYIDTKLFNIIEHKISYDVRKDREDEKWLNIILQKN